MAVQRGARSCAVERRGRAGAAVDEKGSPPATHGRRSRAASRQHRHKWMVWLSGLTSAATAGGVALLQLRGYGEVPSAVWAPSLMPPSRAVP